MNWFQIIITLLPVLEQAVNSIVAAEGKSPAQATADIVNHLTPGQPNSATLGGGK